MKRRKAKKVLKKLSKERDISGHRSILLLQDLSSLCVMDHLWTLIYFYIYTYTYIYTYVIYIIYVIYIKCIYIYMYIYIYYIYIYIFIYYIYIYIFIYIYIYMYIYTYIIFCGWKTVFQEAYFCLDLIFRAVLNDSFLNTRWYSSDSWANISRKFVRRKTFYLLLYFTYS